MPKQTFEDFLMEKHSEQFIGTKDEMIGDFPNWLTDDLSADELIEFADKFQKQINAKLLEACKKVYKSLQERGEVNLILRQAIAEAKGGK